VIDRRSSAHSASRTAAILLITLLWLPGQGQAVAADTYMEGIQYREITPPQGTPSGTGVEVIEMFWYGCRTCYSLQPFFQQWKKNRPASVQYTYMPAANFDNMRFLAQAFYTAQSLQIEEKVHIPLFTAIHGQRRDLGNKEALAKFFAEYGVSRDRFEGHFNSPSVAQAVEAAVRYSKLYGIAGAPTIVINGRYRVDPSMIRSTDELLGVISFLVNKELARIDAP